MDLKTRLVFSQKGRPRGRGRIERFFSTINQRVLSELPGYLVPGQAVPEPLLSMEALEKALRAFILGDYHHTPHSSMGLAPVDRWQKNGFLPHLPNGLEALDQLLRQVASPRQVHRDGIRLNGLRYIDPALAAYVGEAVLVRYDPADMSEIRVFHGYAFLCRAICPELSDTTVSLQDILEARRERQRALRRDISHRRSTVDALLGARSPDPVQPRKNRQRPNAPVTNFGSTSMKEISPQALPTVSRGFVPTREYRRFGEFCEACRRKRYIGLCHGAPGVGKTVSARTFTRWSLVEGRDPFNCDDDAP